MKRTAVLLLPFVAATMINAQPAAPLPTNLADLARVLPELAHNKQLDFGPFSEAFWNALQTAPASADSAIPILAEDFGDPDPKVQFHTASLLYGIEMVRQDSATIFAPLYPQLAKAISQGDPDTQAMTLLVIATLRQNAPDVVVRPIEQLIVSRPVSDKVKGASVGALMAARPADDAAQGIVIDLLNDTTLSMRQKEIVLDSAARAGGGPKIVDYVVLQANTATDETMRDTAFMAATSLGSNALNRISDRLNKVAQDPREPPQEREIARHALSVRSQLSHQ